METLKKQYPLAAMKTLTNEKGCFSERNISVTEKATAAYHLFNKYAGKSLSCRFDNNSDIDANENENTTRNANVDRGVSESDVDDDENDNGNENDYQKNYFVRSCFKHDKLKNCTPTRVPLIYQPITNQTCVYHERLELKNESQTDFVETQSQIKPMPLILCLIIYVNIGAIYLEWTCQSANYVELLLTIFRLLLTIEFLNCPKKCSSSGENCQLMKVEPPPLSHSRGGEVETNSISFLFAAFNLFFYSFYIFCGLSLLCLLFDCFRVAFVKLLPNRFSSSLFTIDRSR